MSALNRYTNLGRTGLRVSPLCFGTMTFGTEWGWGSDEATARALFDRYVDAGGNFFDTADVYTNGRSEEMLGRFVKARSMRDLAVIGTKFTFNGDPQNPNAGGNGRKNVYRALEGSLRRLGTDYVDVYWLHAWDTVTPVEEVLATMDDLVRVGKVRYFGLSNVPAWYAARMQTLAEREGRARVAALQLEYSLVERSVEREHVPLAQALGMGVLPWSPLASGFLAGRYRRDTHGAAGEGRLAALAGGPNPVFDKFTDRNWTVLDAVLAAATELGRSPGQVALNWVATQPGVASTLIGATRREQLDENLAALDFTLAASMRARLDAASALPPTHPYMFFGGHIHAMVLGGARATVEPTAH